MNNHEVVRLSVTPLAPFGVLAETTAVGADVRSVPAPVLSPLLEASRILVLRGFSLLDGRDLVEYCASWGEVLTWDFGTVLELSVHQDPKNYLFTDGDVPFHWDGAFAAAAPSYIVFQCVEAPVDPGGETVFCDSVRVFDEASDAEKAMWRSMTITYCTEKLAHYGGRVTVPLVSAHPHTALPRLRYAEPLDSGRFLNPLSVEVTGLPSEQQDEFFEEMRRRIYQPDVCYAHRWHQGDLLIADNHALLHGRRAFRGARRRLQRVHIL